MKKLIFALALTCCTPCVAASAQKSASVEKCLCDQLYIDAEDITIIQDRIIVSWRESLYFADGIHCDEDGLYVTQDDLQAILDGDESATRHDSYEYPDYASFYDR